MKKMVQAAARALVLAPSPILAQDFDAGVRAAEAGDYKTALKEWRPLAEQGDTQGHIRSPEARSCLYGFELSGL